MTLHEAIEKILKEAGKPLAPGVIADLVNSGSLYVRDDNTPVPPLQIEARIKKYPLRFTLTSEGLITLAENRKDPFNDIVLKVFDILRGTNVTDVNYFISSLFFYKRALDYPEMLNKYELEIASPDVGLSATQRFRSFYKQLKDELAIILCLHLLIRISSSKSSVLLFEMNITLFFDDIFFLHHSISSEKTKYTGLLTIFSIVSIALL